LETLRYINSKAAIGFDYAKQGVTTYLNDTSNKFYRDAQDGHNFISLSSPTDFVSQKRDELLDNYFQIQRAEQWKQAVINRDFETVTNVVPFRTLFGNKCANLVSKESIFDQLVNDSDFRARFNIKLDAIRNVKNTEPNFLIKIGNDLYLIGQDICVKVVYSISVIYMILKAIIYGAIIVIGMAVVALLIWALYRALCYINNASTDLRLRIQGNISSGFYYTMSGFTRLIKNCRNRLSANPIESVPVIRNNNNNSSVCYNTSIQIDGVPKTVLVKQPVLLSNAVAKVSNPVIDSPQPLSVMPCISQVPPFTIVDGCVQLAPITQSVEQVIPKFIPATLPVKVTSVKNKSEIVSKAIMPVIETINTELSDDWGNESIEVVNDDNKQMCFDPSYFKLKPGTRQHNYPQKIFKQSVINQGENPHAEAAALRVCDYDFVNKFLVRKSRIIDWYGNARTPMLLSNHMVHVMRYLHTVKDKVRLDLCAKRLTEIKVSDKFKYEKRGTYCKHDITKCACAKDATVFFLNDVYDIATHEVISKKMTNNQVFIAILKVFPNDVLGGDIAVRPDGPIQGTWYRTKDARIVYTPNTEHGDIERHYVHPSILSELYHTDVCIRYGIQFTVLQRTSLYSCASVIVHGVRTKSATTKSEVFNFNQSVVHSCQVGTALEDWTSVLKACFNDNVIPEHCTALFDNVQYEKLQIARSVNTIVDDFTTVIGHKQAHGHKCKYCLLTYVHIHPSGEDHMIDAKHAQKDFDCPYVHCEYYNHVDCNCTSPQHKLAQSTLINRVKTSYRLDGLSINAVVDDIKKVMAHCSVDPNVGETALKNAMDKVPITQPITDAVNYDPVAHTNEMTKDGKIIPDNGLVFRTFNKEAKSHDYYLHCRVDDTNAYVIFCNRSLKGSLRVRIQHVDLTLTTKFICSVFRKCNNAATNEMTGIVTTCLTTEFSQNCTTDSIITFTQFIANMVLALQLKRNVFEASMLVEHINDARTNKTHLDHGFFGNLYQYGFRKAFMIAIIRAEPDVFGIPLTNGLVELPNLTMLNRRTTYIN
jgi:hypothetical protein